MRVLIVEDDPELAGLLRDGLRAQRIDPTLAATFDEGRERAHGGSFDVIILDVRLPGGTGFELCGELRRGGSSTPVLMLTALDALDDRVRGLEAGADDYLTKPFAFRELVARLKALARRRPARLLTVFAGQDADATARARSYFTGYAPSSPQMALFKDGALVYMLERKNIEGRPAQDIAADLTAAFDRYC